MTSDDLPASPPPSGGPSDDAPRHGRRRGRRGGRGRGPRDGDDAPRHDVPPEPLPASPDRRAPLSRYELLHPAPIPGRLREGDAVEDLETLLEDLDPAALAAIQQRAGRGDAPRGDRGPPRERSDRGDRPDRGDRGDRPPRDRAPHDRAPHDRGPHERREHGDRRDRGDRDRDRGPRGDRRDDRPRSDRGVPPTPAAAASPRPSAPPARAEDDFGFGILEEPRPARPAAPDPFEAPTQEARFERPAPAPAPAAAAAPQDEDDGFGSGIL